MYNISHTIPAKNNNHLTNADPHHMSSTMPTTKCESPLRSKTDKSSSSGGAATNSRLDTSSENFTRIKSSDSSSQGSES